MMHRLWYAVFRSEENRLLAMASPLIGVHIACLAVFWVGVSPVAVAVCAAAYAVRMFAITAGFHRYFSHRSFSTSRGFQFVLAWLGTSAAQLGPLWWAAHHRHHHAHSDEEDDIHSPVARDFYWAHVGWLLSRRYGKTNERRIRDLLRYPELRWLDRWHVVAPLALAGALFGLGAALEARAPGLGTTGWQMVIWGFFISTALAYHATFCVNSVTHVIGSKRFATGDESRNNWWVALLTMGEGWHNNHHRYPGSARQGLYWWEIDVTWYVLRLMAAVGLVWDLRVYPSRLVEEARSLRTDPRQPTTA